MTAPRGRRGDAGPLDGGFSGASLRGALLIAVAVVVGVLLVAQGLDRDLVATGPNDPSDGSAATDDTTDTTGTDGSGGTAGTGSTTGVTPTTHVAAQVKVVVLNGGGPPGSAGTTTTALGALGFATLPADDTADVTVSSVYFVAGYEADAAVIATALGVVTPSAVLPTPPPTNAPLDANVVIVLGPDFTAPT